jgi:uncharacterized membrane protein
MRRDALRNVLIVLAVIGIALAGYLTYVHYANIQVACVQGHNECEAVQTSVYSKLAGVPVALLGLIGYIVILGTLLVRQSETTRLATLAIALGGWGFSVYLTYREVFSLEKICEWCVGSAILLTIIMLLSAWRFLRGDPRTVAAPPRSRAGSQEPLGTVAP